MISRGNAKALTNKLKFGNVLFWVSLTADIVPGVGLHAPVLLYNIIPGISLLYNNGFPIIIGHKIHVILGVF